MKTVATTIAAAHVAEISGLPTWRLIELEPEGFGCPRDRVRFGGADHYTVPGAWRLVCILDQAGEAEAARRLREDIEQLAPVPEAATNDWWQHGASA